MFFIFLITDIVFLNLESLDKFLLILNSLHFFRYGLSTTVLKGLLLAIARGSCPI